MYVCMYVCVYGIHDALMIVFIYIHQAEVARYQTEMEWLTQAAEIDRLREELHATAVYIHTYIHTYIL